MNIKPFFTCLFLVSSGCFSTAVHGAESSGAAAFIVAGDGGEQAARIKVLFSAVCKNISLFLTLLNLGT